MTTLRPRTLAALAIVATFVVAACTPAGGAPATDTPPGASTPGASAPSSSGDPGTTDGPGPIGLTQAWATATLTDVATGEDFTIAGLAASGQVVFIETMAIWCTNCRRQQQDAQSALGQLDRSNVTWLSLDIELSETATALKEYRRQQGFDFRFAVASRDVAIALADEFGDLVLSPPSTPIIVVAPDGSVELTEFGHKSVDRIIELARARGV